MLTAAAADEPAFVTEHPLAPREQRWEALEVGPRPATTAVCVKCAVPGAVPGCIGLVAEEYS